MAAETNALPFKPTKQTAINLISGLFVVVGLMAILGLLVAIITNPLVATEAESETGGGFFLAFLNNFGIVIPALLVGFGVYFIRLALKLRTGNRSAAIWGKLYAMWIVVLSVIGVFLTIFNSLAAESAAPEALPILLACIALGVAAGLAYNWFDGNEDQFEGEETISSRDARLAWNLLIPTLAVLIFVAARPLERTFIASLTDQRFAGGEASETTFIGLDNYTRLLGFRIDALPCTTDDSGECATREDENSIIETRELDVDPQAVRDIVSQLQAGERVSGVPNLLNAIGEPDAINEMLNDEAISPVETLRGFDDGDRALGSTMLRAILSSIYGEDFAVQSIENVDGNTVTATVEIVEIIEEVIRPSVREVVGEDYRELQYSPVSEFNLFGAYYVFSARDGDFLTSIGNTMFFTVISVTLELVLGMIIALVVNSNFPGRGIMRAAMLVPWAIPTVVSAKLWEVMLRDNQSGVINFMLLQTGLIDSSVPWLASTDTQIWSLIFVDVWKTTPFMALLLLAGLQIIPKDVYEAADVDGASRIRQFFSITLPLLRPTIAVALVFRTLDAVRAFDVFDVLVGKQLQSMATYNKFILVETQQFGYASAIGVTMFVIILIFTVVYVRALGVDAE